jgi:Cys-tRNA(Pro)/Cys-tRNA(Cys) deacylase
LAAQKKTNAVRIAESKKVPFELMEYEVDEDDLSAENAAEVVGMDEREVFKTLVARGDKSGVIMACLPAGKELNLKALAAASGNKKAELVHLKEVFPLTGYVRGGCSPIGTKKRYQVYLDSSAMELDIMAVNAGARGLMFKIAPKDLAELTGAKTADLTR